MNEPQLLEPLPLDATATLHRLDLPLPLQLRQINVYLILGPDGVALVDTGMDTGAARTALEGQLRRLGLEPRQIDQVFVTHFHTDHFGLAPWLQRSGARVSMPRVDAERLVYWFNHPEFDSESLDLFGRLGVPGQIREQMAAAMVQMRASTTPFVADRLVDNGQTVELAGLSFEVLETPGHSPAHACLYHAPSDTLLVGDHVLPHITPNISITQDRGEDPLGDYRRSLRKIRDRGFTGAVLPAHGPPVAALDARIDEILEHHDQREALLLQLLTSRGPATCHQLSEQLFATETLDGWQTWMATGETLAHLKALEVDRRVERLDASGGLVHFRSV